MKGVLSIYIYTYIIHVYPTKSSTDVLPRENPTVSANVEPSNQRVFRDIISIIIRYDSPRKIPLDHTFSLSKKPRDNRLADIYTRDSPQNICKLF